MYKFRYDYEQRESFERKGHTWAAKYSENKMTNVFEREDMHWHMINSSSSNDYISPK